MPHFVGSLPDSRYRRSITTHPDMIIEADDAHLVRARQVQLPHGSQQTSQHFVIAGKHRGWPWRKLEDRKTKGTAIFLSDATGSKVLVADRQVCHLHRLTIAGHSLRLREQFKIARHQGDTFVSQIDQML